MRTVVLSLLTAALCSAAPKVSPRKGPPEFPPGLELFDPVTGFNLRVIGACDQYLCYYDTNGEVSSDRVRSVHFVKWNLNSGVMADHSESTLYVRDWDYHWPYGMLGMCSYWRHPTAAEARDILKRSSRP